MDMWKHKTSVRVLKPEFVCNYLCKCIKVAPRKQLTLLWALALSDYLFVTNWDTVIAWW